MGGTQRVGDVTYPYPQPASPAVTAVMKGNRRSDTRPETALRSELHARGLRFRKDLPLRAGATKVRPDIVFTRRRVAIFVDGCFWHGCPIHGREPGGANADYWKAKIQRNRDRDLEQTEALEADGWVVVRVWEHAGITDAADVVQQALASVSPERSDGTA